MGVAIKISRNDRLPARSLPFLSADNAEVVCHAALRLCRERKIVAVSVSDLIDRTGLKPDRVEGGIMKAMELQWLSRLESGWVLTVGGIEAVRRIRRSRDTR